MHLASSQGADGGTNVRYMLRWVDGAVGQAMPTFVAATAIGGPLVGKAHATKLFLGGQTS